MRPFCAEDPLREEQFRTQMPKLRLLTTIPLAAGEEWGTRAEFSPLVEGRDIDFARASVGIFALGVLHVALSAGAAISVCTLTSPIPPSSASMPHGARRGQAVMAPTISGRSPGYLARKSRRSARRRSTMVL